MTSAQLYHNLPTANTLNSENSLYHVLDALTALGVIHIVDEERTRAKRDGTDEKMYQRRQDQKQREQCTGKQERAVGERAAEKSADKAANTNDFDTAQSNPSSSQHQEQLLQQQEEQQRSQQRYVFLGGQARIDRLTIPQLLPSLQKAQQDIDDSVRRIRLLREELMKRVPPPRLVTPQQNKDKTLSKNVVEDEVIDGNEHCEESDEISMTAAAASSDDIALNLNKKKHQDGKCEKEEHSKRRSMREVMTCLLSISPSLARDPFYSAALENVGLTGGNSSKTHGR